MIDAQMLASCNGGLISRGIHIGTARFFHYAYRRPPYARSRPSWMDNATNEFLKVAIFPNVGIKHEFYFAEWITRGK